MCVLGGVLSNVRISLAVVWVGNVPRAYSRRSMKREYAHMDALPFQASLNSSSDGYRSLVQRVTILRYCSVRVGNNTWELGRICGT